MDQLTMQINLFMVHFREKGMEMKKVKIAIRIMLFCVIFCVLFIFFTEILKDKRMEGEYNVTTKVRGFYQEPENSLDFVFVGSSQLYADVAPAVLFTEYGMTSYDFAANEQPLWITYFYIKEALKHQKPKAIVLDVFTVYGEELEAEGVNHINLDDLPFGKNKIDAIKASVPKDMQLSFFFEMAKYHTTWNTFYTDKYLQTFEYERDKNRGYSPFIFAREYEQTAKDEVKNVVDKQEIPTRSKEWLQKIITLTKEEGVDLILIKTPNGNAERQAYYLSVADLAKEEGVPFLNLNSVLDGEAHVNVIQAEVITKYIGSYLAENYSITDKRKDPAFSSWKTDSQFFYRYKAKCELISATNFSQYVDVLKKNHYVIMMTGKKSPASPLMDEVIAKVNELPVKCELNQVSEAKNKGFIALVDDNQTIFCENSEQPMMQTYQLDTLPVTISYSGASNENITSMLLGGVEYDQNVTGLNFVIYDRILQETVDMSSVEVKDGVLVFTRK